MQKLKHKLKYSIDLGIDFLSRNIDSDGIIANEKDLYSHILATLVLAEFGNNEQKTNLALQYISSHSCVDKDEMFIVLEDDSSPLSVTALAGVCFILSISNKSWGIKFANRICSYQDETGFIKSIYNDRQNFLPQCIYLFIKTYEYTKKDEWLHRAVQSASWLIQHSTFLQDYWNMFVLSLLKQHMEVKGMDNFMQSMVDYCDEKGGDLDMYVHYGAIDQIDKIKKLFYERLVTQKPSSDPFYGGAFFDGNRHRLDWSFRNIQTFQKMLLMYN